jgi:hypothetical protein
MKKLLVRFFIPDVYFVPVVTFLLYHVADYIGRELARVIEKVRPQNLVLTDLFILKLVALQ